MTPDNKPMPGPNQTLNQRVVVLTSIPVPRACPSSPSQEYPAYQERGPEADMPHLSGFYNIHLFFYGVWWAYHANGFFQCQ